MSMEGWNPDLETGNAVIDNQHKQLFVAVHSLVDAYRNGNGRDEVEKTMEFLVGYTLKHFADEEALQKKYDYPDFLAHKRAHSEFKGVAQELVKELSRNGPTDEFISKVYVIVGEWLVNHIKGDDFKMAAYVQQRERNA
jgi:hemerythrin